MNRFWISQFTFKTWAEAAAKGHGISGFRQLQAPAAQRVQPGDVFLCYMVDGGSEFIGALRARSTVYEDDAPVWSDEVFPVRFLVEPIVTLGVGVPIHDMPGLKMYSTGSWKGKVRRSLNEIDSEDGQAILAALQRRAAESGATLEPSSTQEAPPRRPRFGAANIPRYAGLGIALPLLAGLLVGDVIEWLAFISLVLAVLIIYGLIWPPISLDRGQRRRIYYAYYASSIASLSAVVIIGILGLIGFRGWLWPHPCGQAPVVENVLAPSEITVGQSTDVTLSIHPCSGGPVRSQMLPSHPEDAWVKPGGWQSVKSPQFQYGNTKRRSSQDWVSILFEDEQSNRLAGLVWWVYVNE